MILLWTGAVRLSLLVWMMGVLGAGLVDSVPAWAGASVRWAWYWVASRYQDFIFIEGMVVKMTLSYSNCFSIIKRLFS